MYRESNEGHPTNYVQLSNKVEGTNWQIIRHKLSTLGGNSGSPIYYQQGDEFYLFAIHTTGDVKEFNANYNLATYIFSEHIYSWLIQIPDIKTVFDY